MPLPPYADDSPTQIFNITVFLSSYDTGRNFTITDGTASGNNETLGDIMTQQPGSTVKHIDWVYPDCLVGDGAPDDSDSDRGLYNVSGPGKGRRGGSGLPPVEGGTRYRSRAMRLLIQ